MLLTLVACSSKDKELENTLFSILNNEKTFIAENGDAVFLEDYVFTNRSLTSVETYAPVPTEYTFVDFDKDGAKEFVVNFFDGYESLYLLFHIKESEVYGYEFKSTDLQSLKSDGSFMMTTASKGQYICNLTFNGNKYILNLNAAYDPPKLEIGGELYSEVEVQKYISEWQLKENATWHSYGDSAHTNIVTSTSSVSAENTSMIDLSNYITVTFEGKDMAGYATVTFDKERFLLDNINKVSFKEENMQVYNDLYGYVDESAASAMLSFINVKLDVVNKLSNGDTVQVLWELDSDKILSYFNVNYIHPPKTYVVTGLENPDTYDPFENLTVQFSGISPYGTASCSSSYDYYGGTYTISPSSNLKNGSKVKVTYNCQDNATMMELYGTYPSVLEKTYTVKGLSSYVKSTDEISDDQYNQMVADAAQHVYVPGYGYYSDATYCGNFFFTSKGDPNDYYYSYGKTLGNMIFLVFSHPSDWDDSYSRTVYSVIRLDNIIIDSYGNISYFSYDFTNFDSYYENEKELKALANGYKSDMKFTDNLMLD